MHMAASKCLVVALILTRSSALFGTTKKVQDPEEEHVPLTDAILVKDAMKTASTPGFDASAALHEIRSNPEVQKKMRHVMQNPEALAELRQLMRNPTFKAQVDAFTASAEVVDQVSKHGVSAFLGAEPQPLISRASASDIQTHAAARAEADLEYKKYSAQFSGQQNVATGLQSLVNAAKDPSRLADAMADLKDPEMMKSARQMMADPAFQVEMQRMMERPKMRKIVEASRSLIQEVTSDPGKMADMHERIAKVTGAASPLDEF